MARQEILRNSSQAGLFDASDESTLAAIAAELGGLNQGDVALAERDLLSEAHVPPKQIVASYRKAIKQGMDPLGDAFMSLRSAAVRRSDGAVYTPFPIIEACLIS